MSTTTTAIDWRAVADGLAAALEKTMLRNAGLDAQGWNRAEAALRQWKDAADRPACVSPGGAGANRD